MTKIERVRIWNDNFRKWNGFSMNDETWIVIGNTYEIKDELKTKGAKFSRELGWHFDIERTDYLVVKVHLSDVAEKNFEGKLFFKDNVYEFIKDLQKKHTVYEPSGSNWVGEKGMKIHCEALLKSVRQIYTAFGEAMVYEFKDENENTLVWMTGDKELEEGYVYDLIGWIKDHTEFRGDKQTRLTRCRIVNKLEKVC